jgi:hypothetical protein
LLTGCNGQVVINEIVYHTTTSITNNYIYSIAKPIALKTTSFINQCFFIREKSARNQHKLVSKKIVTCYATITGKEKKKFSIIKDSNDVPFLFCKEEQISIPVSITHHGRYAAFTIY